MTQLAEFQTPERVTQAEIISIIERAASQLGEHVTAVQIHASFPCDGGGTRGIHRGTGDWYARQGLAHEFIEQDKASEHAMSLARVLPREE